MKMLGHLERPISFKILYSDDRKLSQADGARSSSDRVGGGRVSVGELCTCICMVIMPCEIEA